MAIGFREYIAYAERHLAVADEADENTNVEWLLIPVVILAWAAIESFVNNMLDDFGSLPEDKFQLHERALLSEQKIKFIDKGDRAGNFTLEGSEYRRLDNKILFLIAKFGGSQAGFNIKGESLWQRFEAFKKVRDALMHPRRDKEISINAQTSEGFIETSKEIIMVISEQVWNEKIHF